MSFISIDDAIKKLNIEQGELKDHVKKLKIQVFMAGLDDSGKKRICIKDEDLNRIQESIEAGADEADDEFEIDLGDEVYENQAPPAASQDDDQLDLDDDDDLDLGDDEAEDDLTLNDEDENEETLQLDMDATQSVAEQDDTLTISDKRPNKDETLSFNMSDDITLPDDSFAMDDDDSLTINDELSRDEDSEASLLLDEAELQTQSSTSSGRAVQQPKATTKIIDEPNAHFIWSVISIFTFCLIAFIGVVAFGIVKGEGTKGGLNTESDSFYSELNMFVQKYFYLPPRQ